MIDELRKVLNQDSSVLELGSGPGTDWEILSKHYSVTGSDLSEEFLKHLCATFSEGTFINVDACSIHTDSIFDCIYSNKVLHHLNDEELKLSVENQFGRLNTGGIVCHSFWKGEGSEIFKGMFVNYHTKEEILSYFSTAFEIIHCEEYTEFDSLDSILILAQKKSMKTLLGLKPEQKNEN